MAATLTCSEIDLKVFDAVMNEVMSLPIFTVVHVPKSVRPLLAEVLSQKFQLSVSHGAVGFMRLFAFTKSVLCVPSHGGKKRHHNVRNAILSCLKQWKNGDLVSLWLAARLDARCYNNNNSSDSSLSSSNARRAIRLSREGRYSDAVCFLSSEGCADYCNSAAFAELPSCHPDHHSLPDGHMEMPAPLVIERKRVLECYKTFPRGSSPGASQLCAQHLLDAICGTIAPSGQSCLDSLTFYVNDLIAGKLPTTIAPWLCGAPLTTLKKKSGGFRPIAVGETIRRLASRVCCLSVRPRLEELLLPYGQVRVGIRGGL